MIRTTQFYNESNNSLVFTLFIKKLKFYKYSHASKNVNDGFN